MRAARTAPPIVAFRCYLETGSIAVVERLVGAQGISVTVEPNSIETGTRQNCRVPVVS
jgi:hypothetical protein